MSGESLDEYMRLAGMYRDLWTAYEQHGPNRDLDPNDKEQALDSAWAISHYFEVGRDALRIAIQALIGNRRPLPTSILDFPSGSGRVTRHFRAFFPATRIVACDLYPNHVDFCRETLGTEGILSRENPADVDFGEQFDLIFCGSLLTHLPEELFRTTLNLLARSLTDRGIAIVTLQGRYSEHIQRHKWKYLEDRLFDIALKGVRESGFGYVDYNHDFRQIFDRQARYGIALVSPERAIRQIRDTPGVRILGYAERDWDNHQDVAIFGKPDLNL